jgi:hypothetical protein
MHLSQNIIMTDPFMTPLHQRRPAGHKTPGGLLLGVDETVIGVDKILNRIIVKQSR